MDRLEQIEQDRIDTEMDILLKWGVGKLSDRDADVQLAQNYIDNKRRFRIACGLSPEVQYDCPIEYR